MTGSGEPVEIYRPTPWKWFVFSVIMLAIPGLFWLAPVGLLLAFGGAARLDLYADRIEQKYLLGRDTFYWSEMENIRVDGVRLYFIPVLNLVYFDRKTDKTGFAGAASKLFGRKTVYPFGISAAALARRMIRFQALQAAGISDTATARRVLAQLEGETVSAPARSAKPAPRRSSRATAPVIIPAPSRSKPAAKTARPVQATSTPLVQEGGWFRRDRSTL